MTNNIQRFNIIEHKKHSKKYVANLDRKFNRIFLNILKEKNNQKNLYNLFNKNFKFNFNLKDLKRFKKFKTIALIGMGGSILGPKAIHNFLETKIKKKIYFFDNLDREKIVNFNKKEKIKDTLFLITSKSGNTIETITNLLTLNIIKKNKKNLIIVSEKKDNFLFSLSKQFQLFHISHKKEIGGRFSVLSEVGMVPTLLMGLSITKMRQNIRKCFNNKNKKFLKDSSLYLTKIIKEKKIKNLVFLNFNPKLKNFLFWLQQLISESLGKKGLGLTPLISECPKDYHSMLQLYLDGPKDKLFYFFSLEEKVLSKLNLKKYNLNNKSLNNKDLTSIKNAQKRALMKSFEEKNIPFKSFILKKCDETNIGELFSYFIIETIIVGKLLKVDPFNQPSVEQVKINTKKELAKSTKSYF